LDEDRCSRQLLCLALPPLPLDLPARIDHLKHLCFLGRLQVIVLGFKVLHVLVLDLENVVERLRAIEGIATCRQELALIEKRLTRHVESFLYRFKFFNLRLL